jgi:hypothetical protein
MDGVPGISQNQALEGFDLFYLLPNVLVGSYPAKTRKILHSTRKPTLMMLTDYLIENFEKVLIINLVAENVAYTMPADSSHSIQQLHIHWFDYHALPLHELSSLVHDVPNSWAVQLPMAEMVSLFIVSMEKGEQGHWLAHY